MTVWSERFVPFISPEPDIKTGYELAMTSPDDGKAKVDPRPSADSAEPGFRQEPPETPGASSMDIVEPVPPPPPPYDAPRKNRKLQKTPPPRIDPESTDTAG